MQSRFEQSGWSRVRERGNHVMLTKPGSLVVLTVPLHGELV
ncbi:MAG: type II toxin-antitoxin system HicA family toxin [Nitrospirae bacterium]|nr:MAG: type II toxin-antitoxin system HicA family toxin [Nitrospirota bacterium]